ncbi:MAG: hypothetical protein MR809_02655 [Rikenellaceae bacterium]|nr:hypothetical protein [Rikenellaceae bacterium]
MFRLRLTPTYVSILKYRLRHYSLCIGALPLKYPAAPPSVFAYYIVKYTASAVALVREMASNQMPFLVEMGLTKQSVANPLRELVNPCWSVAVVGIEAFSMV